MTTLLGRANQAIRAERLAIESETFHLPVRVTQWPAPLEDYVYHGLLGEIVRTIEPHTEADPAAVLVNALVALGNCVGRNAYFPVEADSHYPNLYAVLVGDTSMGRKGTSWGYVRRLFEWTAPDWMDRIVGGLSSGEGLAHAVRDANEEQRVEKDGTITGTITDPGVADKRLMVLETEFGSVLKVMQRDGSTLSPVVRQAWQDGRIGALTKNSRTRATNAHVSILGHITAAEVMRQLDETDAANGFANRFLWLCVRRSKELPEGGNLSDAELNRYVPRLRQAIEFGSQPREVRRDDEARKLWASAYSELTRTHPGMYGSMISRGAPIVVRLSLIYALADCSPVVRHEHLMAALALWQYAEESARFIFGDKLGHSTADEILAALRARAPQGMTRTEISGLFNRNRTKVQLADALGLLQSLGLARCKTVAPDDGFGGRPAEMWYANVSDEGVA